MYKFVVTSGDLHALLRTLREGTLVARFPLALNRYRDSVEFLVHHREERKTEGRLWAWSVAPDESLIPSAIMEEMKSHRAGFAVGLGVGIGSLRGQVVGFVLNRDTLEQTPLKSVQVIGPGMPEIQLGNNQPMQAPGLHMEDGLYSRIVGTHGALPLLRLQRSRIAIIGAGGNGSLFAGHLARLMSPRGQLTLIDGDRLGIHNLIGWGGTGAANQQSLLGRYKAEALAELLRKAPDPPHLHAITSTLLDWSALAALKQSEIFVCCVDNPTARYVATFLSTLYLRPLVDVSSGVFLGQNVQDHAQRIGNARMLREGSRQPDVPVLPDAIMHSGPRAMGADVRLIVPGGGVGDNKGGCLLCHGGVGDLEQVQRELDNPSDLHPFWYDRAGTDILLNSDAVSQGVRLLLSFLAGQTTNSEHQQMDIDLPLPPLWRRVPPAEVDCVLCAHAGLGDSSCGEMEAMLNHVRHK